MNQMSIPTSEPNDSDDVTLALETAEALWNKGDPSEALRWLRRAAEAAGDSGDDMRAVVLAKAVAELNEAGPEQSAPKPVRPPPLPPQAPATKSGAPEDTSAKDGLLAKGGLKGASKPPPPPPSARKSMPPKPPSPPNARLGQAPAEKESAADAAEAKSATQHKVPNAPVSVAKQSVKPKAETAKSVSTAEAPKAEVKAAESSAVKVATRDSTPDTGDEPQATKASSGLSRSLSPPSSKAVSNKSFSTTPSRAPAAPVATKATSTSPGKKRNFARAAVRVYVATKDQSGDRLEVHVLNDGQRPPPGAVEALLVPLRRGAKLIK